MRGFTLIEMVVTVAILSTLAVMALPHAKVAAVRNKEMELQRALREVRSAIDAFHSDWEAGRINRNDGTSSRHGYPVRPEILVEGVHLAGKVKEIKRYLRRIPVDPFADATLPPSQQWQWLGYLDALDSNQWNGEDVYDLHSRSRHKALNKSVYHDW